MVKTLLRRPSTFGTFSCSYSRSRRCLLSFCYSAVASETGCTWTLWETHLLKKVVNIEIHLQYRSFPALVVQCDDECTRCWGGDVEIDIGSPIGSLARCSGETEDTYRLSGTLLSTMIPSFSSWACVNRYGPST